MSIKITRKDVNALAGKLEEFANGLPEQEKNVLGWVLERARSADVELSESDLEAAAGGTAGVPFHSVLESAAGLGRTQAQSDSVKWTHTFQS
jgi:hypothetical protein